MDLITLDQLRKRAKLYAKLKNIEDSEWDIYINDAVKQYWNIVNVVFPDYNLTSASFNLEPGTAQYTLNSDVLVVRKVSCHLDGDPTLNSVNRFSLRTFSMTEADSYSNNLFINNYTMSNLKYRVWDGNSLLFQPVPQTSYLIVYYYLPVPPVLSTNDDTVNGISGLDVYISALAAKTALDSRRISNIYLAEKVSSFVEFIKEVSNTHNSDEAEKIEDVSQKNRNWWY